MTESNMTFFDHTISPKQAPRSPGSNRSNESSKASSSHHSAGTSISVIIGKTFEAATLPDGSQQIIEATKYKRLSDGYIYTESKMRSLDDDRSGRSEGGKGMNVIREVGDGMGAQVEKHQQLYPDGSFLSTFSSSGSFSPENGSHHVSVVTEDHGFITSGQQQHADKDEMPEEPTGSFVEEYLFDNDPMGFQQWSEEQPLSPSEGGEQKGGGTNGGNDENNTGWFPSWSDADDDNSLQLMPPPKRTTLWDSPATKRAAETMRNFFPSTPKSAERATGDCCDQPGFPLDVSFGRGDGDRDGRSEGEEDEAERGVGVRKLHLPCNERMRTRRCRVLVLAIVAVVIVTIAVAVIVSTSASRQVRDSPAKHVEDTEEKEESTPFIDTNEKEESPPLIDTYEKEDSLPTNALPSGESPPSSTLPSSVAEEGEDMEEREEGPPPGTPPSDVAEDVETGATAEVAEEDETAPPAPNATTSDVEAATDPDRPSCIDLKIFVSTTPGTNGGDVNEWSLTRIDGEGPEDVITIDSGDAFPELDGGSRSTFRHCVRPGVYTFEITDSGGDGLGTEGRGGYYITADDVTLGISSFFFHEERMTFTLPFDAGGDHDGAGRDDDNAAVCTDDFFLAIKTDGNPEQTEWNVVDNDSGDRVLGGGPYSLPWAVYTQRACLPDGNYTFNMTDEGGDGVCCDDGRGFVFLSKDGETIVNSDGDFGKVQSMVFLLGGDDPQ